MTRRRISTPIIALILAAGLCAAGCIKGPAAKHFDPLYDKFGEVSLAGDRSGHATYILDGFSMRWQKQPHRLSKLAAGMMLVQNDAAGERVSAIGRLVFKGGAWSEKDDFDYDLDYTLVRSKKIHFYHGEISDIELRNGVGERDVVVNLGSHGMALFPKDQIAVFVRGFYFDTGKSHANGFPISKFAVEIKNPVADNQGVLKFTARMKLEAGVRHMYLHYKGDTRVAGKLFYTVAATRYGVLTTRDHGYDLIGPNPGNPADRAVSIEGAPEDYPLAFVGASRISMDWGDSAFLIRGITFRNKDFSYDPATGRMRFVCNAGMDNTGENRFINQGRVDAAFVLMQVDDSKGRTTRDQFDGKAKGAFIEHKLLSFTRTFNATFNTAPAPVPAPDSATATQPLARP